jgi:hypothetical protein
MLGVRERLGERLAAKEFPPRTSIQLNTIGASNLENTQKDQEETSTVLVSSALLWGGCSMELTATL